MIQPRLVLRICAAVWGLAIAIAAAPLISTLAPHGQLPGLAKTLGIDARAPFRFVALLVTIPLLMTWTVLPVLRPLLRSDTRHWARNTTAISMLVPIWFVTITQDLLWAIVPTAVAIAVCLIARHLPARFRRYDAILLPTTLTIFFSLIDIVPLGIDKLLILATATVLAVRLSIVLIPRPLPPSLCFAFAPLALILQSQFLARDQRHFGWAPLLFATLTPFAVRLFAKATTQVRVWIHRLLAFVIFPVVAFAYASAASLQGAEGKPRSDLFEGADSFLTGAEMMRGERPYRDIIPTHGLISDALLSYGTLKTGPQTIGRLMRVRGVAEGLNYPAGYFLGFAASGSPEVGLLSFFLAQTFGTADGSFRILPALITLAILAAAVRRRKARWFAAAGIGVVVTGLTSVDFGVYIALVSLFAGVLMDRRNRAIGLLLVLAGGAVLIALSALAIGGILSHFFRTTLFELPLVAPAYSLGLFSMPSGLKTFRFPPEVLAALFDKTSFLHVLWAIVLIVTAATAMAFRAKARRRATLNALRVLAIFVLLCVISYAERHHLYWQYAIAPLMSAAIFRIFHSANATARAVAPLLVFIVVMIAQPTIHLAIVASLRNTRGPMDASLREVALPRARGAYFSEANAAIVEATHRYIDGHLRADETFFDFTNHGLLYFLVDRDCPIRQFQVAFYERESLQREVIARIEQNTRIRAAVTPLSPDRDTVDGVPNAVRAPLVWKYLQAHFEPDVSDGGVAFWRRK